VNTRKRTLIFFYNSPTVCRPQTFLPSIDFVVHTLSTTGHPRAGAMTPPGKRLLSQLRSNHNIKQHRLRHTLQQQFPTHNLSFPTTCPTQGNVPPSLLNSPSGCPTSLLGLQQQADQEVSELCSTWNTRFLKELQHPLAHTWGKLFPTTLSPRENAP
jgi:hypothetical protein